ncbi:unnamed protein product [Clonostachys solani]|uniref:Heterokaryon incompatibility domain-containing protein n=1 Tax=Clonostachys solani TaxID=160281 RepID=A0A9P0EPG9_9HYPO|nr:unnamed protein product [Clonostachys solani]
MSPSRLPTRLLNVGGDGSSIIKLQKTKGMNTPLNYIVLSFVWGSGGTSTGEGLTFPHNIEDHERGIDFSRLPKACRDAITITRELGIEYLWIDSLCIVQGPDGDFAEEARSMEGIFNNSYCLLAACSSSSIQQGFLEPRQPRRTVSLGSLTGEALVLCELVDDFERDVDLSPLYSRGWTLQERTLARRTIFFTSKQMYWQCGEGIRCETLTKMSNFRAGLYGSPDFPKSFLAKTKISPVSIFKDLYKTYSRLQFSNWADRPIAILGLEHRLSRETGCKSRHGIVLGKPEYLGQSLMWRAATETGMCTIKFPSQRQPPSWSWMAYTGEISYLDLRPGEVEWESSISMIGTESSANECSGESSTSSSLSAQCLDFNRENLAEACYDGPEDAAREDQKCVIVGRSPGSDDAQSTFYLLLIARGGPGNIYLRIGVALAESKALSLRVSPEDVVII